MELQAESNNPLNSDERRIAGFSRYAVSESGVIRNILTGNNIALDAEKGRYRLVNDEGQRKWFDFTTEVHEKLFAPPVPPPTPEDPFTKEIVSPESPVIETYEAKYIDGVKVETWTSEVSFPISKSPAKGSKKGLSDDDIRSLRVFIDQNSTLKSKFKDAGEKYGVSTEHARRIWKRQYFPNVV